MPSYQSGGAFLPEGDMNLKGLVNFVQPAVQLPFTAVQVTATGATGSTAASLGTGFPAVVAATGASGAGVNLPTGACVPGAVYAIKNMMTGALNIYSVGCTINGTTGTTAYTLTATGNLFALAFCVNAVAWQVVLST